MKQAGILRAPAGKAEMLVFQDCNPPIMQMPDA